MKSLKSKIDAYLWAFMWVLPVFIFFVMNFRTNDIPMNFWDFMMSNFSFPFVRDILDNVCFMAFGTSFAFSEYIAYLVGVEVFHCFFDVMVFIPRIAHSFVDRAVGFAGGEKK